MSANLLLFLLCVLLIILIFLLFRALNLKKFAYLMKGDWSRLKEEFGEENSLVEETDHKTTMINSLTKNSRQPSEATAILHSTKVEDEAQMQQHSSTPSQWGVNVDLDAGSYENNSCEVISRSRSTESIASSVFSNSGNDDPTVLLTILYQNDEQMLVVKISELYEVPQDLSFYLLIYLLPHPKPLWRTEIVSTKACSVSYDQTFRQCIRPKDLKKIAMSIQLHIERAGVTLEGQNRIPLRHLDLNAAEPISVPLLKNISQGKPIGELYLSLYYQRGRLSIAILKVRNLNALCDEALVRIYLVESNGRVIRKRTSPQKLVDGGAQFNESIFINLSRTQLQQSTLRLSITHQTDMPSFGRVTVGPKADDKGLIHWQRMLQSIDRPIFMWHSIMAKK